MTYDDIFFGIVRRGGAQILLEGVGVAPLPNCRQVNRTHYAVAVRGQADTQADHDETEARTPSPAFFDAFVRSVSWR